jgi:hypothetical protein
MTTLGERWALGLQPKDVREALTEVAVFLARPLYLDTLPTEAEAREKYGDMSRFAVTKESELERARHDGIHCVEHYLARTPLAWQPGMWKPTIPNFVEYPVLWRANGTCEDCGSPGARPGERRVLHHLHYRSVGCEVPDDLLLICRDCHRRRHVFAGQFFADPETHPLTRYEARRAQPGRAAQVNPDNSQRRPDHESTRVDG